VLLARRLPIAPDDDAPAVTARLADLGADALLEAMRRLDAGEAVGQRQDDAAATLAPLLTKAHARLDWARPASALHDQVRAFRPWPGAVASWDGRPVKILETRVVTDTCEGGAPGEVLAVDAEGLRVATGRGTLLVTRVQPESRRPVSAAEFARGARVSPGMLLA
jgi:methionyl-tRNA formyltransferase